MRSVWFFALVVFFAFGLSAQEVTGPLGDGSTIPCTACAGEGQVVQECWLCSGSAKHRCPQCSRFSPSPARRWSGKWLPSSVFAVLVAESKFTPLDLDSLGDISLPDMPKKSPKRAKLKPGELMCPAGCRGGKLLLIDEWIDCKLCRAGKLRCGQCKRGQLTCRRCDGKRRAPVACDDCTGAGNLPDPRGLAVDACPWCLGKSTRTCHTCDEAGAIGIPCLACFGRESLPCEECLGIGKVACKGCGGRGRTGRRKEKCEDCRQKGVRPCAACERGLVECASCAGYADTSTKCGHCGGKKQHPCNGCEVGAYAAWERTGEWFLRQQDPARATAWFDAARARCEQRYSGALARNERIEDARLRKKLQRAIESELEEELRRLDKMLEGARGTGQSAADG